MKKKMSSYNFFYSQKNDEKKLLTYNNKIRKIIIIKRKHIKSRGKI